MNFFQTLLTDSWEFTVLSFRCLPGDEYRLSPEARTLYRAFSRVWPPEKGDRGNDQEKRILVERREIVFSGRDARKAENTEGGASGRLLGAAPERDQKVLRLF